MNRFVKDNRGLIAAIIAGSVVALGLLIFAVIGYVQMALQISKTDELRNKIKMLNKQTPAPVEGNKPLIEKDIELYTAAAGALRKNFGQPYKEAVDRFITVVMELKPEDDLNEARAKFKADYDEKVGNIQEFAEQNLQLQRFRKSYKHWDEAAAEFLKLARDVTQEPNLELNLDEVILGALGVPRKMQGNVALMSEFMEKYREKLKTLAGEKLSPEAENFGLLGKSGQVDYPAADYPYIVRHLDIIGDLVARIGKSGITTLDEFAVRIPGQSAQTGDAGLGGLGGMGGGNQSAGDAPKLEGSFVADGGFKIAHYTFAVSGSMNSIRQLARDLDAAYSSKRVYIVRSIFLFAPEAEEARAAQQLAPVATEESSDNLDSGSGRRASQPAARETAAPRRRRGGAAPAKGVQAGRKRGGIVGEENNAVSEDELRRKLQAEMERKFKESQAKLPFYERFGYGEVQFGGNFDCRAIFDVDYVMLNQ